MNIYLKIRELAKSIRAQNLFLAAKEVNGIRIFRNSFNLSKLQEIYLSQLYNYDSINRDIILEKISKHVTDNEIYTDAYLLWKQKNIKKINKKDNKQKDVNLVVGKEINFPTKGI
jgi:hypothetical protein